MAKPRVAAPCLVTPHPAVGPRLTPRLEPLHTRRVAGWLPPLRRPVAVLASGRVACPLLRAGHAAVAPGRRLTTAVSQAAPHRAGGALAPVATPRALDAHCPGAAGGTAARSAGAAASGCPPRLDPRADHPGAPWPLLPAGGAQAVGPDLSRDRDPGGARRGRLAVPVGPQPLAVEGHLAPAGLGRQGAWGRPDTIAPVVHQGVAHLGGNATVPLSCFLPRGPRRWQRVASGTWPADRGRSLEALETTRRYVMPEGSEGGETVGIRCSTCENSAVLKTRNQFWAK